MTDAPVAEDIPVAVVAQEEDAPAAVADHRGFKKRFASFRL